MLVRLLSSEINSEFDIKKAKSKYISILHFYVCRLYLCCCGMVDGVLSRSIVQWLSSFGMVRYVHTYVPSPFICVYAAGTQTDQQVNENGYW